MTSWTSCEWLWVYAGAALMLLELATTGFVAFFFGLSAATVGLLRSLIGEPFGVAWQLASFSVLSIVYIVLLRKYFKMLFVGRTDRAGTDFDRECVGRAGKVTVAINPPRTGRVMLGDAEWTASADVAIPAGADVKVISQDNLTMKVEVL